MPSEDTILDAPKVVRVSSGSGHETAAQRLFVAARERAVDTAVVQVGSTGVRAMEPLVLATGSGRTAIVRTNEPATVVKVVDALEGDEEIPVDHTTVAHEDRRPTLPVPDSGPLGAGRRRVLATAGWLPPTDLSVYRAGRGIVASDLSVDTVFDRLENRSIRGRGRGDGSTDVAIVDSWRTATDADGEPIVVVNANEASPNATADRLLLETAPLSVLDGAVATARTVGATEIIVYVNETATVARRRTREAADQLLATFEDRSVDIVTGPDEYKAGEMTMALEAIEGNHRIEARLRPPYPSESGIDGRPTLIHTPRTLAQLTALLGDRTDTVGVDSDPGTRLLTVVGDVESPAMVELSTDDDLSSVLDVIRMEGRLKAACVGDVFGGITPTLDVPVSVNGLSAATLGTNGVVELINHDRCVVSIAGDRAKFAAEENCGRCVTCREGSKQLVELLRGVYDGRYERQTLDQLGRVMTETSLCGFGQEAPRPVVTAMDAFETEFHSHANGRCPSGECEM